MWATRWGIAAKDGDFSDVDYVRAAVNAGSTENGVFGVRIMWGSMEFIVDRLRAMYPNMSGNALDLLDSAFGNVRFVCMTRENVLAQAISWLRAEQTDVWHLDDPAIAAKEGRSPRFDYDELCRLSALIENHNQAWASWFEEVDVQPYVLKYEDLDTDPVGTTRSLLDFLGLCVPEGVTIAAPNARMARRSDQGMDGALQAAYGKLKIDQSRGDVIFRWNKRWNDRDLIFCTRNGGPQTHGYIGHKWFKQILKHAGLRDVTFHT